MLSVIKNFVHSEKAVASFVVLIGGTVLAAMERISAEQWIDFSTWILGIYIAGKSVQGAAAAMAAKRGDVERLEKRITDNDGLVGELVEVVFGGDDDDDDDDNDDSNDDEETGENNG